jgi:hypothetical protein
MNPNEFIIPNSSSKRNDVQILEAGPNPGVLYSIVDEGTHYNKYFEKSSRTVRMIFEFPLLKQLFNEGDTEERPTVVSQEYTFVLGENSNLKKFIDGAEGRILQPAEYRNGWNIGQYLGRTFMVDIVNKPNKKDPTIIYNNIGSVKALTDTLQAKYNFDWAAVTRTNPLVSFMIDLEGKCFNSEEFTKLPNYLQKKVKDSDEALMYINNGGVFADKANFNNGNGQAVPPPVQRKPSAPLTDTPKYKMLVDDFTYEQYKASGWTDEQLLSDGKIELNKTAPPVAPKKAPLNPPAGPSAPGEVQVDDDDVPF